MNETHRHTGGMEEGIEEEGEREEGERGEDRREGEGARTSLKSQKFYLQACGRTAQEYEETF
jgi:hypothetical protein